MKQSKLAHWVLLWIAALSLAAAATSGATFAESSKMPYTFEFNTFYDNQNTSVASYELLSGNTVVLKKTSAETGGDGLRSESIFQWKPRPTMLSIEWSDLSNGKKYKDKIDLGALPSDISMQTLFVEPKGAHISIYLISRDLRPDNIPPVGPPELGMHIVKQIYSN